MIEIKYYRHNDEAGNEALKSGKITTLLLATIYKKCLILGYTEYTARDHEGNKIHEKISLTDDY